MRLVRSLTLLVVAGVIALSACGSEDETPSSAPTTSETSEPTPSQTEAPEAEETAPPEEEEGEEPAPPVAVDICALVTPDEVASALGAGSMTTETSAGTCLFQQEDKKAPLAGLTQLALSDLPGGIEGVRDNLLSSVAGEIQPLPETGDDAFFVVGRNALTDSIGGAAGVVVGDTAVIVQILQNQNLPEPDVGQLTIDVATLVASKL